MISKALAVIGIILIVLGVVQFPGVTGFELAGGKPLLQVGATYPHEIVAGSTVTLATHAYYTTGGVSRWIPGAAVTWSISGGSLSSTTATTDSDGYAYTEWTAPLAAGMYTWTYSASHPDYDLSYAEKTIGLAVVPKPTAKTPTELTIGISPVVDGQFSVTASLEANGVRLPHMPILIYGAWQTTPLTQVTTETGGVVTVTLNAPSSQGTYTVTASFPGDDTYESSQSTAQLTVGEPLATEKTETVLTVYVAKETQPTMSVVALDNPEKLTVHGSLKTPSGSGVADKTLTLMGTWGYSAAATTDANGAFQRSTSPPSSEGTYTVTATFGGDEAYLPSAASTVLQVTYNSDNPPAQGFQLSPQPYLLVPGVALLGAAVYLGRREAGE